MIAKIKACSNQKEIEAAKERLNSAVMPDNPEEQQKLIKELQDAIPEPEYSETEFAFDVANIDWAYPNISKEAINIQYKGAPFQVVYSDEVWSKIKERFA